MGILGWIIFGLIVGLLARAVMPGPNPMSLVATIVLGVLGALLAGWVGSALGWYTRESAAGIISAVFGAVVLLAIGNGIKKRRRLKGPGEKIDRDRFAA